MATLDSAIDSIISEREYQDARRPDSQHEIAAYILYMGHHLDLARSYAARGNEGDAMAEMRKVAALYVAAAEQHGASHR